MTSPSVLLKVDFLNTMQKVPETHPASVGWLMPKLTSAWSVVMFARSYHVRCCSECWLSITEGNKLRHREPGWLVYSLYLLTISYVRQVDMMRQFNPPPSPHKHTQYVWNLYEGTIGCFRSINLQPLGVLQTRTPRVGVWQRNKPLRVEFKRLH